MDTKADAQLVEHFASRVPGVVSVYSTLRWRNDKPRLPRSDLIRDRPFHYYIHRLRRGRRAIWTLPADRVADALLLRFFEAARPWTRLNGSEDGLLVPRRRSVDLAREDGIAVERREEK